MIKMKLTEHVSQQLSTGAISLTLLSALTGGHLTASCVLYIPGHSIKEIFMAIALGLVVLNGLYFFICFVSIVMNIPNKSLLLKSSLFMLINIPLALGYIFIVIGTII